MQRSKRSTAKRKLNPQQKYARTIRGRYTLGKHSAKSRRIPWDLSLAEYSWLVEDGRCDYCGGMLEPAGVGLDRIDLTLPYSATNAIACCYACNMLKGDNLSRSETRAAVEVVKWMRGLGRDEGLVNPSKKRKKRKKRNSALGK